MRTLSRRRAGATPIHSRDKPGLRPSPVRIGSPLSVSKRQSAVRSLDLGKSVDLHGRAAPPGVHATTTTHFDVAETLVIRQSDKAIVHGHSQD
jgi:hypothetical protein